MFSKKEINNSKDVSDNIKSNSDKNTFAKLLKIFLISLFSALLLFLILFLFFRIIDCDIFCAIFTAPFIIGFIFIALAILGSMFIYKIQNKNKDDVIIFLVLFTVITLGLLFGPGIKEDYDLEIERKNKLNKNIEIHKSNIINNEIVCYSNRISNNEYINSDIGYKLKLPDGWQWGGISLYQSCKEVASDNNEESYPYIHKGNLGIYFKEKPLDASIKEVRLRLKGKKEQINYLDINTNNSLFIAESILDSTTLYIENDKGNIILEIIIREVFKTTPASEKELFIKNESDIKNALKNLTIFNTQNSKN